MNTFKAIWDVATKKVKEFAPFAKAHPLLALLLSLIAVIAGVLLICAGMPEWSARVPQGYGEQIIRFVNTLPQWIRELIPASVCVTAGVSICGTGMAMLGALGMTFIERRAPDVIEGGGPGPSPEKETRIGQADTLQDRISALEEALQKERERADGWMYRSSYFEARKNVYKFSYFNQRTWRRLLLRGLYLVPLFGLVSLIAAIAFPLEQPSSQSAFAPVETLFQRWNIFSREIWHGIVGLIASGILGLTAGWVLSREKFTMVRDPLAPVDSNSRPVLELPVREIVGTIGFATFAANLAYLLINSGYYRFFIEDDASNLTRPFDKLVMVVVYRLIGLPFVVMLLGRLAIWARRRPKWEIDGEPQPDLAELADPDR